MPHLADLADTDNEYYFIINYHLADFNLCSLKMVKIHTLNFPDMNLLKSPVLRLLCPAAHLMSNVSYLMARVSLLLPFQEVLTLHMPSNVQSNVPFSFSRILLQIYLVSRNRKIFWSKFQNLLWRVFYALSQIFVIWNWWAFLLFKTLFCVAPECIYDTQLQNKKWT